ncbi:MAG: Lrp/AsnC ligand binding domain-containing protein [Nitrosopumilus sp.]|nr:Lrp/AsnC ligand binding domain-containing protein [Nitrosopumilus sp.]
MPKAYVMMNCDLGSEKQVIADLKKINGVKEAHGTLGMYDIIAQIEADSEGEVKEITTMKIRNMPKIHSTVTLTRSESEELFQPSEKLVGLMLGQNLSKAYVVIHCDNGEEYTTLKNLSHIPEVKEGDVIFGFYDVICKVEASDEKTLNHVLTKAIRSLPHIKTSMTLNIINEQES